METSPFLDEIRAEAACAMLLRLGRRKFGTAPSRKQQKDLKAITDLRQLESLADRVLEVDSWDELLNGG